ncbi:MAG: protease SohB [Actinomycetales bacterium]|nr:protease SohB [Actinomycetales bacterium]
MSDVLWSYGLFLAEALTVVLAVLVLVAGLALGRRRLRRTPQLVVTKVNDRYDAMARAIRAGLVPRRTFRRELRAERKATRARNKAESKAGGTTGDEAEGRAGDEARGTTGGRAGDEPDRRPRVFVLDFLGDLRASRAAALREEITALLTVATPRDEVLVRLENYGGRVHDQGFAASQLLRVRERGIPLTVAVDRVAASGGYLMACVADRILAAPFAAVGSIGVIWEQPNVHRFLDRHGVDVEQFKGGEHKRTVTLLGRTTDEDRERLAEEIRDTHELFKEFVARHRPQVDIARVATGQYWYGTRALELDLVDELTTSDDYLLARREVADLLEISFPVRTPPLRRLAGLVSALGGSALGGSALGG